MILITGSSGFIGSHLVPLIRKVYKEEKIFLLDKPKYDLITGKNLDKIPSNPRLIIHLAGTTDTSKRDHKCNDVGTKNLLERIKEIDSKTHIIYTSSLAIYSGRTNCAKPITALTKPATTNEYGRSKLRAEKILIEASKNKGFALTIIRLPTVWGENPRKNSFLSFLRGMVKSRSFFAQINWRGKLALMGVDDAAKYLLSATSKKPKNYQILPVACQNLTLSGIFKILTDSQGKDYKQIKLPNWFWSLGRFLRNYLKYFEFILPASFYNYFWRASIVWDNPLWCNVNVKGTKFTS